MTYEETLHYLYTSIPVFQHSGASAYKPGLGTSIALDDYLGNPHKAYKTIHVAGTNGKGSVSHLLAAILRQSGFKVGLYTSPHLVDFRERIRVNGKKISQDYVVDFVERHRSFFEPLHPSFFELTSSMAFEYFRDQQVDYAVIEVGLGGRLDSTNIITPILSIITNISLDHTQFLGDTEEKIAAEKAGIIKKDCPIVTIMQKAEAMVAIEAEAEKQHARLYTADVSKVTVETETLKEIRFDHPGLGTVTTRLTGTYQVENCCLAVTVLKDVLGIADQTILDGIQNTVWPGRFEVIGEQPLFIIDGAHNEDAALQLSASVEKYFTNIPITYIIGVLADKEHKKVLEAMLPYAGAAFTVTPDNPRAMKAEELASEAEAIVARLWKERAGKPEKVQGTENSPQGAGGMEPLPKVSACSSMKEAVQLALEHTKKDGVILAFGSLSYLKEIRQIMQSD